MIMRWRAWACAVLVVAAISCDEPVNERRDAAPATPSVEFLYQCYPGFPFDPFRFEPGNAEDEDDPVSRALRRVLEWEEATILPQSGWSKVGRHGNRIGFITRDEQGNFYDARVKKEGARWTFAGLGQCKPGPSLAIRDRSVVEWVLNPDEPSPEPGDRVIHAMINEFACHGFGDPLDRLDEPRVLHDGDETYIALTADPLQGFQMCPGTPSVPFEIELNEPLSTTNLFDASIYPPRSADRQPR
jgi:hypothetical protein